MFSLCILLYSTKLFRLFELQPKESTNQILVSRELVDFIGHSSPGIGTRLISAT